MTSPSPEVEQMAEEVQVLWRALEAAAEILRDPFAHSTLAVMADPREDEPTSIDVTVSAPGNFQCDEKRFYIPGAVVHYTCLKCGCANTYDLEHHYLGYPRFNGPEVIYLGECLCGGTEEHRCYEEREIAVRLNLSIEVLDVQP